MKYGLKDPRPGAIPLRFSTYADYSKLPTPPTTFGHMSLIPKGQWGMLGNDQYGDCAIAGACHQTMLWTAEGGKPAPFNTAAALKNYSDVTGFSLINPATGQPWPVDPSTGEPDNPTDQGTDLGVLAQHWLTDGIVDADGVAHRVIAVVDLNPGDLREIWVAQFLFQSVGLGYALPNTAEQQTQAGLPWDVVPGATIVGGHYVPSFSRLHGFNIGVTWGKPQPITPRFIQTYNDQGLVALSEEMLVRAKNIDGFDDALLRDDIAQLSKL